MVQIDKNIPFPEQSMLKYPYRDLEVGDSFPFPKGKTNSVYANSNIWGKQQSPVRKFKVRKNFTETEARLWRVE